MSLSKKLKKLLFDREITPTDLAKALNIPTPTIHRIVTGRTIRPHEKSIRSISEYFGVTPQYLTEEKSIPTKINKIFQIPLVNWENLDSNLEFSKSKTKIAVSNISDKSFAVIMPDHSMEPLIEKDSTLIFDPEISPIDRNYVLVKVSKLNLFIVRQLLLDLDNHYIKALNNDLGSKSLRLVNKDDIILAKLIEIRKKL